jgi:uncharacterized repeat protein (TIGR03803 family)
LHYFSGEGDGLLPSGSLTPDGGALYGTTMSGGLSNDGTVFALTPPTTASAPWTEAVIHSFAGGQDGNGRLYSQLLVGNGGVIYRTTFGNSTSPGTVFELTPPTGVGSFRAERVLRDFNGGLDGFQPIGGLVFNSGYLFGTTSAGGGSGCFEALGCGAVFGLRP